MNVLYGARMARFGLLRAVCSLATQITKWGACCDKRLHRLMCYIKGSIDVRMVGSVGDEPQDVSPVLFADADFAGCPKTARSTSGVFLALHGPSTRIPLQAFSKR